MLLLYEQAELYGELAIKNSKNMVEIREERIIRMCDCLLTQGLNYQVQIKYNKAKLITRKPTSYVPSSRILYIH